jgi:imidazoleglycerol-phosphate dehydratase/histidinol-phosphatase
MIIFIDRDGTLIHEPENKLIANISQVVFKKDVFLGLQKLKRLGYEFVIVTNQDDLGTPENPEESYQEVNDFILTNLNAQGITIKAILTCPHAAGDKCNCRKPNTGLVAGNTKIQWTADTSFMVGDRQTDIEFSENLGIDGFLISSSYGWLQIANDIARIRRATSISRQTNETNINLSIIKDSKDIEIQTGIPFFDHMLEQLAKHSRIGMKLQCDGDLQIDEHHTVEDVAITLGQALNQISGNKVGIQRYAFILPMDESISHIAIDLCGRSNLIYEVEFERDQIGDFPTEMVEHFFKTLCDEARITLHIKTTGKNTHHMIESIFKGFGKCLGEALSVVSDDLPSTKGLL